MFTEPQRIYENKRVVLITGAESNWFEQAIFIVKKNRTHSGVDVVREAERIIESYINKDKGAVISDEKPAPPAAAAYRRPKPPRRKTGGLWGFITFACAAAIIFMACYMLLAPRL